MKHLFQGPAAEHRPGAQRSVLQRSWISERSSPWTNSCTQNCVCKRRLTKSTSVTGGKRAVVVHPSMCVSGVCVTAARSSPAAASGQGSASSQTSTSQHHPSGSSHCSSQRNTHWSTNQQPTTCGPTLPGPGTALPILSGLPRVSHWYSYGSEL